MDWLSSVAGFYKSVYGPVAEHLLGKPVVGFVGDVWSAEYAWAKRHPTIASVAVGAVAGAVAGLVAPAVLGVAAISAAGAMIAGGVGAFTGALAQYYSSAHLTGARPSGWEAVRQAVLAGSIGILTAGIGSVVAKALGPVAAELPCSPAVQKGVVTAVSEAGSNGLVKGTVAANQKVIDNVVENMEKDRPLLSSPLRGVATETAKQVVQAGAEGVVKAGVEGASDLHAVDAATRGASTAAAPVAAGLATAAAGAAVGGPPALPGLPASPATPVVAQAPVAQPPRRGFVDLLDDGDVRTVPADSVATPGAAAPLAPAAAAPVARKASPAGSLANTAFGD